MKEKGKAKKDHDTKGIPVAKNHPLHKVASRGNIRQLRRLLKTDKELLEQALLNSRDDTGRTPLHHATQRGSLEIVKELVNFGADINAPDATGCPPVGYAQAPEIQEYFYDKGVEEFDDLNNELHLAVLSNDINEIKQLIKSIPSMMDEGDYAGNTPLHLAVMLDHLKIVKMFCAHQANLEVQNNDGHTPVFYANKEIRDFLLKSGAIDPQLTSLHIAALNGNVRKMRRILNADAQALNAEDLSLNTPLHFAVLSGNLDAVKLLVEAGAEVNAYNEENELPIDYTTQQPEIRNYLLEQGSVDPECTELHIAASEGNLSKLEEILDSNPEAIDEVDSRSNCGLYYAATHQQRGAVKFLLDRGASIDLINEHQINMVEAAKEDGQHTPLSKYIQNKIKLSKDKLDQIYNKVETLLKEALIKARAENKKLLIVLGETHHTCKIAQIERIIFKAAVNLGITTLLGEYGEDEEHGWPEITFAKKVLGMETIGVDNHIDKERDPCSKRGIKNRNIMMAKEAARINKDAVLLVGSDHLKGLLIEKREQINSDQFHVVPINLSSVVPCASEQLNNFQFDAKNVLQYQHIGGEPRIEKMDSTEEEDEETEMSDAEEIQEQDIRFEPNDSEEESEDAPPPRSILAKGAIKCTLF